MVDPEQTLDDYGISDGAVLELRRQGTLAIQNNLQQVVVAVETTDTLESPKQKFRNQVAITVAEQ